MIIMVNAHVIKAMIYIIAKQMWVHKSNNPYEHGCISNAIHVCH